MAELSQHFNDLLSKASCKVENILPEWDTLKNHMLLLIKNNTEATYRDIQKFVFMNEDALKECKNSLMVSELLLINPMFSRISCFKTDWRSRLSCINLDV